MKEKIEIFHLLFLQFFGQKIDKSLYAIKGGCNLRFFFGSIRYSEDLDIDFKTVAPATLKKKVEGLIDSENFKRSLNSVGLLLEDHSAPKQTETTQRWKFTLLEKEGSLRCNTKIEFSRRGMEKGIIYERFPEIYTSKFNFPLFTMVTHYNGEAAFSQKIMALIGRMETQARDIFDLYHLMTLGIKPALNLSSEHLEKAQENVMSLGYKDYKSQVVAYLEPTFMDQYESEEIWKKIVSQVLKYLDSK